MRIPRLPLALLVIVLALALARIHNTSADTTPLATLAASMAAGRWEQLATNNINPTFVDSGTNGNALIYTDDITYDPTSKKFFYFGSDHGAMSVFASFDSLTNTWQKLARASWMPSASDYNNGMMHAYNNTAIDAVRGFFYHRPQSTYEVHRYNIATQTWDSPAVPQRPTSGAFGSYANCCDALEHFPELGGLVWVAGDAGTTGHVYLLSDATNQWTVLPGNVELAGTWHSAKYNPVYHVLIFYSDQTNKFYKLDSSGNITTIANPPFSMYDGTGYVTTLTVDPVSGQYLALSSSSRQLYTYNVPSNTWQAQASANKPDLSSQAVVATPVSSYGVTFFTACKSAGAGCQVYLYKHQASASQPPPTDTTPPAVSMSAPATGSTSSATVTVSASASDDVGVAGVQFKLDGNNLGAEDTASPYSVSWNTTTATNASHALTAMARDAAGNQTTAASIAVLVNNAPSGGASDVAARCAAAGVVRCFTFDVPSDFNTGSGGANGAYGQNYGLLPPYGTSDYSKAGRDTTVSADGGSSLRFTISSNSGSDMAGSWFTNFSPDLATQFGENSEFYVQYRQRFSPEMLSTNYAGTAGWKQDIIGSGDKSGTIYSSCTNLETVVVNNYQRGFPQMYNSCTGSSSHGSFDGFEEPFGGSDFKLQNARTAPYCLYSQNSATYFPPAGNCFGYVANEWMTFQIHIKTGPRVNDEFTNSHVDLWVARDGQPSQKVINWGPYNLSAGSGAEDQKFGKVWLLPYMTGKSSSQATPTAYTWYDDLIISRNLIADPGAGSPPPVDTAPPVLSGIAASGITNSGGTISWTTDEAADTQVEYGQTTAYGSQTTLNSALVTSHSQALSGLTAGTTYNYRVKSRDAAGNLATSSNATFITSTSVDTTPPVLSSIAASGITTSGATISWTTNEPANSQVNYGPTTGYGQSTTIDASLTTAHSVNLSGMPASTTYHFRVNSMDAAGNLATSGDSSFTTVASGGTTVNINFQPAGAPAYPGYLVDDGSLYGVRGNGYSYGWNPSMTNEPRVRNSLLSPDARYDTFIHMQDAVWEMAVTNGTYTVHAVVGDPAFPDVVSNLTVEGVSAISGSTTDSNRWLENTVTVSVTDGRLTVGNLAGSYNKISYITVTAPSVLPPDTTPPVLSSIAASGITTSGGTVSWTTNEAADTQVEYGQTTAYGSQTTLNSALATAHSQALSGLTAGTTYNYRVKSRDAAGNLATSPNVTFITSTSVDTTPPVLSSIISGPGTTVSGTAVTASVTATDNVGVVGVQFKLDGANLGAEDMSQPFSISWNTTGVINGTHSLTAVARDAAGNTTTSAALSVTVNNPDTTPPAVSITSPAGGSLVAGSVTVSASASDNVGVVGVQFKLDGTNLAAEDTLPPYSASWNTTTASNGVHTLTAVARDAAGNQMQSATVSVTASNGGTDTTPPTVSITDPVAGSTITGTVAISATASDNIGIVGVQFQLDGANLGAEDTSAPYSVSLNSTTAADGNHTILAVARDAAGNQAVFSVTVNLSNAAPPPPSPPPSGGGGGGTGTPAPAPAPSSGGTAQYSIPVDGGQSWITNGTGESITTGYARVQAQAGTFSSTGLAIFGFRNGQVLISEASVPASQKIQSGRIYVDLSGPVNTGVAFANTSSENAMITFYFTDVFGNSTASETFTLAGNSQLAKFLNESPFNGRAAAKGTFTFDSSIPVGVIALRGFTNERSEFLMTTLPVAPILNANSDVIVLPQFADGGGWTTQVILTNPLDSQLNGTVQFFGPGVTGQNAPLLTLSINGSVMQTFSYVIPARSSIRLVTGNSGDTAEHGSVRISPTGAAPMALAIFSFKKDGVTVSEAGVSALPNGLTFRLYVESSGGVTDAGSIQSGVAMVNPSMTPINVTLQLTGLAGSAVGMPATLTLPAGGQIPKFVRELFPDLPATFQGFLKVTANSPIGVTGLRGRYNERGDFLITTTPPRNEDLALPASEIVFPHIVTGGGYNTQFILYGDSGSGSLWLNSRDGTPLSPATLQSLP